MNYRIAKILAQEDLGAAGTKTIDINVADIISRISLRWQVTKSKDSMDSYPHKDIAKIELVDGSEVLHSLNGGQNQALAIYDRKCDSLNEGDRSINVAQVAHFGIDFGRFLFDPMLALDPKRFKNLQLKITWDEDVSDTGVTTNGLEVLADCFDEKIISPLGFLLAKEHYSYTPGAENSYEYIDLPTDRLLRKLLIQGYRTGGYEPWAQIKEAKLDEDNDKRIPFDWDVENYTRMMKGVWRAIHEYIGAHCAVATQYLYLTPTDYCALFLNASGAHMTSYYDNVIKGGYTNWIEGTSRKYHQGFVVGWLPNHCIEFPFGDSMDMADWYDVTKVGSLRLRLRAGSSGTSGNGAVILQQLRRY